MRHHRTALATAALGALLGAISAYACGASDGADLAAEAQALARVHKQKLGPAYETAVDVRHHLVYVSALDAGTFRQVRGTLARYADAQRGLLFPEPPPWNVVVVLPTLSDYRRPGPPEHAGGYYQPATRTLTSLSVSDVLIHEFTHALHHADQVRRGQRHPIWIAEGLATFFQGAWTQSGILAPQALPDLATLQGAIKEGSVPSLGDLCAITPTAFQKRAETAYPYVRYVMLWLYRQGKLRAFYEAYTGRYAADTTGRAALESLLGKPLAEIDAAWRAWLADLEPPWTPAHPVVAHLGVRMRPDEEGVRVDGFLPKSVAETAGVLRVGDVLISLAGRATPTARDLSQAVRGCKPGETVTIEILREGRREVVTQVLGAVRQ